MLICDLRLPGINGFQVVRALCAMQQFKTLQIVVVSGLPLPEIEAHGGMPERVEIMSKPIDFNRLKAIAQGLAEARAANPERTESMLAGSVSVTGALVSSHWSENSCHRVSNSAMEVTDRLFLASSAGGKGKLFS